MKINTEILKIKGDWNEVVDDCRTTVGKEPLGHEPSTKFKKEILLSEHSPIRDISVKWRWRDMPHWVSVHWVRHKWECFLRTQRSDRTGIPRDKLPQDEPQTMVGEANSQHLIDTWRKRLCWQASEETRHYAENFKVTLHDYEPELSDVLVPNCVYRGHCPEMRPCHYWEGFCKRHSLDEIIDGQKRYDAYNAEFYKKMERSFPHEED